MTGIDELRRTLDDHATRVTDTDVVSRTAAVHHRIDVVRRRRRVGVAAGAAAVLAVTAGVALLPDAAGPDPANRTVVGVEAPSHMTSLDYTYSFDRVIEGDGSRAVVTLESSDEPRLVSWATSGNGHPVRVETLDGDPLTSRAADFADFVLVEPGGVERVQVDAAEGEVGLAVYELTAEAPPGLTEAGMTFRSSVGDGSLIDAAFAHSGDADVTLELESPVERVVEAAASCSGAPAGSFVNVDLGDGSVQSRPCEGPDFDPGSRPMGTATADGTLTARAWVSSRSEPDLPIDDPDVRVAVALYNVTDTGQRVGGQRVPDVIEHQGHSYRMNGMGQAAAGDRRYELRVVPDGPTVVVAIVHTPALDTVEMGFGTALNTSIAGASGGQDVIGVITEPATAILRVEGAPSPTTVLAIATYLRDD
jgi:hypothetical protein